MQKGKLETLLNNEEAIDLKLSYSRISDFDRNGAKALLDKTRVDNQGVKMGSLIDDMLFSPDDFKTKYYVSKYNEPTATLGTLAGIITRHYDDIPDRDEILAIIKRSNLWSTTKKDDLLFAKFETKEFYGYLEDFYQSRGKVLIDQEEKFKADEIIDILVNHNYSKHIFSADFEHHYQYKFEIKVKQFDLRGVIDIISVDHKNKTVSFIDLKTGSGSADEFTSSFIKFRYYLQAAIYQLAFDQIAQELGLEGYTLKPFEFLFMSLKDKTPIRYIVTDKWYNSALNGFETSGGYRYKGLYELLDNIYFHWKNKVYDVSQEVHQNNGIININDNFIV